MNYITLTAILTGIAVFTLIGIPHSSPALAKQCFISDDTNPVACLSAVSPTAQADFQPSGKQPSAGNDCGGYYTSVITQNPYGTNFGDPQCTLTSRKDKLYIQLQAKDAAYADYWFFSVIPCESGYNSNAYTAPVRKSPDSNGTWGLLQMGSDPDGDGRGVFGLYDRGDTAWESQISNAIRYNTLLVKNGYGWKYWSCAK
jgi:hypothetical protein